MKRFWKKVRQPLADSVLVKNLLATLISWLLRLVSSTNTVAPGSDDPYVTIAKSSPMIVTLWHGQHLLAPAVYPRGNRVVAMFSRSADAELNALVAEKFGFGIVRGSGGRPGTSKADKGGARALIALKRFLDGGDNVAMIADIPHGTPREAGLGVITLARISGRPIMPVAIATSRRKVLEKSWDKTAINLPFGQRAIAIGAPIFVAPDADADAMETKRLEVTAALNAATARAYNLVDGAR
ncbi:lysophospholipid acyltransferase family protein [Mesorhizobium sp. CAU 1741]|uniref:lysophospholipid acyltransferase family protein n=1 Tax=Mesorhizobium sp. CAU 1741 TaxID=3140366 RepID=UPI00325A43BF